MFCEFYARLFLTAVVGDYPVDVEHLLNTCERIIWTCWRLKIGSSLRAINKFRLATHQCHHRTQGSQCLQASYGV